MHRAGCRFGLGRGGKRTEAIRFCRRRRSAEFSAVAAAADGDTLRTFRRAAPGIRPCARSDCTDGRRTSAVSGRSREAYVVSVRMHRPGVHGTFRPPPSAEERDPRNRRGAMRRTTCVRKFVSIRAVRRQGGAGDTPVQSSILRNSSQLASGSPWRNRRVRMPKRAAASRLAGRSSMKSVSSGARP